MIVGRLLTAFAILLGGLSALPAAAEPIVPGDQRLSYVFPATHEVSPYRVYIPKGWKTGARLPMIVMLHGGGLTQDAAFDREPPQLKGEVFRLADQYGFILVAPNGYDKSGGYGHVMILPPGAAMMPPPGGPGGAAPSPFAPGVKPDPTLAARSPAEVARIAALSEEDTLDVVERAIRDYHVDRSQVFLMGNSMGGIGTMYLAIHHPEMWRAISPSEGGIDPVRFAGQFDKLRVKGVLLVKKDDTPEATANAMITRDRLRALGIVADLDVVPDSRHETAWYINLPKTFAFFASFLKS